MLIFKKIAIKVLTYFAKLGIIRYAKNLSNFVVLGGESNVEIYRNSSKKLMNLEESSFLSSLEGH